MRAHQVFAQMSPEQATTFLGKIAKDAPAMFQQTLYAASAVLKSRPAYLMKQPLEKRCKAVRQALARVSADAAAEEILAVYFLEARKELLVEWLDAAGIEHEDGALKADAPEEPEESTLRDTVEKFRSVDDDPDREILLQAFAAQSAVSWPVLESMLEER